MNQKLKRSQEDLNLVNRRFQQSQGEQSELAIDKCYCAQKRCDVFCAKQKTKAELL